MMYFSDVNGLTGLSKKKNDKHNGGKVMKKLLVSMMLILGMLAFAAESAPSSTVGYVKYPCVTGSNFIALPMQDSYTTASTLNTDIFDAVYKYDSGAQSWVGVTKGWMGWPADATNFDVFSGQAYWINSTGDVDFIVDDEVVINPAYDIVAGSNAVMVPLTKNNMLIASDYDTETGVVDAVYKYDSGAQSWVGVTKGWMGWPADATNFAIAIAEPHWINATGAVTWPGAKGEIDDNYVPSSPKGNPKQITVGVVDQFGAEYDATTVLDVTFRSFLLTGTGAAVDETELYHEYDTNNMVQMYFGVRGAVYMDLQNFTTWGIGNEVHIIVRDEAAGHQKLYYEGELVWTVDNTDLGGEEFGFQDIGAPSGGPGVVLGTAWISDIDGNMPLETKLEQNYPNPFNPTTTINFSLKNESVVKLNVYNYTGQLVNSLVNGQMDAGYHTADFDASNLSAGVYYYTLEADSKTMTNKMVLVK